MISSDLENINPTTSSSLQNHRFKPCFLHQAQVVEYGPRIFGKIYHKHVKSLILDLRDEPLSQRIPMPKTLRSLKIYTWRSGKNLPLVKKIVKPYIKYLKDVQGEANQPRILKLLPLLKSLEVSPTQASLRILSLHAGFKQLRWRSSPLSPSNPDEKALLMKYKVPLSRNLARIRGFNRMSIRISDQEAPLVILFLETIDQNLNLDSLAQFGLHIWENSKPQNLPEQELSISKVLAKVTSFTSNSPAWYSFLTSVGNLTSLSFLYLELYSEKFAWDLKGLFQFNNFPVLKILHLSLNAHSSSAEMNFFENLSLSPSIEGLSFCFSNFTLSIMNDNEALSNQLFKRIQEAKRVKALNIEITKNALNLTLHAKFACLLISCFENLEGLCYNFPQKTYFTSDEDSIQSQPFEFDSFWMAVSQSKETLQNIQVYGSEIIFPQEIQFSEIRFPKLQKLKIHADIPSATELGRFYQNNPSLRYVILKIVRLKDERELKIFLDIIKHIPEGSEFELHLDVGKIRPRPLSECLKEYIQDVKVRGRLGMYFTSVQVENEDEDSESFDEIAELALEKGCFDPFEMIRSKYY